jgi:hypothetical protein
MKGLIEAGLVRPRIEGSAVAIKSEYLSIYLRLEITERISMQSSQILS